MSPKENQPLFDRLSADELTVLAAMFNWFAHAVSGLTPESRVRIADGLPELLRDAQAKHLQAAEAIAAFIRGGSVA